MANRTCTITSTNGETGLKKSKISPKVRTHSVYCVNSVRPDISAFQEDDNVTSDDRAEPIKVKNQA